MCCSNTMRRLAIPRYSPIQFTPSELQGVAAKSPPIGGQNTNREGQELVQQYTLELHLPTKTFPRFWQVFDCRAFV
jgi:hypothetical protein